ncbi:hypothetical protein QQG09_08335 [Melissococcus plutonius]|uniref:hypothetical protein n=1 Tax=Melissococcus plutonius TaxID=33970 RepID=UPI0021E5A3D3|nr:hypothetical protein [Melissococcus plutonius]MCV2520386.1 hypothetical protein [Melissococcus plutonius]
MCFVNLIAKILEKNYVKPIIHLIQNGGPNKITVYKLIDDETDILHVIDSNGNDMYIAETSIVSIQTRPSK